MGFQESLLRGVRIGSVIGRAAGHRAHGKHPQLDPLAAQHGTGLVPIHLGFHAPFVALWHVHLASQQP